MNKKYALFGVAAVVAIAGVIYFGTGANQQASVANVTGKAKYEPTTTFPTGCVSAKGYSSTTGQPCNALPATLISTLNNVPSATADSKLSTTPTAGEKVYIVRIWKDDNGDGWCKVTANGVEIGVVLCPN